MSKKMVFLEHLKNPKWRSLRGVQGGGGDAVEAGATISECESFQSSLLLCTAILVDKRKTGIEVILLCFS